MLAERLLLSGLNHESTKTVDSDTAVDLEVTSNRPDLSWSYRLHEKFPFCFNVPENTSGSSCRPKSFLLSRWQSMHWTCALSIRHV